jgi:hypothetical protein
MNASPRVARPLFAVMLALTLAAGTANAQTQIKSGWNMFSPQQDAEIGAQSAAEAERQLPVLNDRTVDDYVNRIGQKLAANSGGPQFQYRFKVINASDINAFALPGGYIYLNRGIIDNARNEGEVAGVLAHEIAHVALRHGTQNASKAYAAQAGLQILGGLLGGKVGNNTAQILNTVGGVGLNALFLKFSREFETQADVRGAQMLAASGYSPADMVGFFNTLAKVDTAKKTTWMSHHPAPPDRIARIEKERKLLNEPNNPTTNTTQLAQVQSRMRGLGAAPTMAQIAQGTTSANNPPMTSSAGIGRVEAPSRSFRQYTNQTGSYALSYPSNWRVYESGGFGVTLAPEGGVGTIGGRSEVVYGAIINHYEPQSSGGRVTMESATTDLLNQIRQASPHLKVVRGSTQQLRTSGGSTALAASLRGRNPNTKLDERVTVVTRALPDGHLMYLVFVTPEADAANYSNVLNEMANSIQVASARH